MKKRYLVLMAGATILAAAAAPAAIQLQGVDIFITGSKSDFSGPGGLGGFSPGTGLGPNGTAAELRMYDDGLTNGDVTADDGIWTTTVTNFVPGDSLIWKVASAGFGTVNTPDDNNNVIVPGSGTITFYLVSNTLNDGYKPDTGSSPTVDGFIYTDQLPSTVAAATSIQVTGDYTSELGGVDWTPADPNSVTLTDAGAGIIGDNLYGGTITGLPGGTYNFKVTQNQSFTPPAFGAPGYATGGGNHSFSVLGPSDTVTVTLDAARARVRAFNPSLVAGPPFYAQSSAWGTGYTALEDLGTAVGNIYQKTFTVATAGTYSVRVRQGLGNPFPNSGDYPFTTTAANQDVLVVFDRNDYSSDGYTPGTDLVLVLDKNTRASLNTWTKVQVVGDFMTDFGGAGNWDAGNSAFDLSDAGPGVGATAGDQIFSATLSPFLTGSGKQVKAVGQRTGVAPPDSGFTVQLGGSVDGITVNGNNAADSSFSYTASTPVIFVVDAITGRHDVAASPGAPTRAAYFSPSSVSDWSMY
ncbi:hypothetical protein IT570_08640 [Candidatus Sumerlaeota bacterium]|nr:hypothetical protein [Candidatus Sumerlaeota bacterium]